jgi:hypothetical protein
VSVSEKESDLRELALLTTEFLFSQLQFSLFVVAFLKPLKVAGHFDYQHSMVPEVRAS